MAPTRLPAPSVFLTVCDLLFLFLISICLALRKTYDLARPSPDKGILPKEAIEGFPRWKDQLLRRSTLLLLLPLHALSRVGHTALSPWQPSTFFSFSDHRSHRNAPKEFGLIYFTLYVQNHCPSTDGLAYRLLEKKKKKQQPRGRSPRADFPLLLPFFHSRPGLLLPKPVCAACARPGAHGSGPPVPRGDKLCLFLALLSISF